MPATAERMKRMRQRRSSADLREVRIVLPDARAPTVRRRVAEQVAGLDGAHERDALLWIEAVGAFDAPAEP